MHALKSSQLGKVSSAAYGAAILFAIHLLTSFIPALRDVTTTSSVIGAELLALLAVAEHLILFPVVAALPAPRWAKTGGYGWLVLDIATDMMRLNGVVKLTYLTLRHGANVAAALWIASTSWQTKGAMRVIGWLVALDLFVSSFIAFIPFTFVILLPSLVLLPMWFVLVGRLLAQGDEHKPSRTEESLQQATPFG
jgi:hypothetical protein